MTDGASPLSIWFRSALFALIMSPSLKVISSSPRAPESVMIAGRTCGGDTATTSTTIQSGRANRGSNPRFSQSSSEIFFKISNASSAKSSRSPVRFSSTCSSFFSFVGGYFTLKFSPDLNTVGWIAPHPRSSVVASDTSCTSCEHFFFPLQRFASVLSRACGCFDFWMLRNLMSRSSTMSFPQSWQTHERIFCSTPKNPQ
mmetsp:Transcript_11285/g.22670  ORF Transcript_11285/g.22670 Transcript_11285/m.22670 type:complete len:200 (+) Transcript_11285:150-749(+)